MIEKLKERFEKNPSRHPGLSWDAVWERLGSNEAALRAVAGMEETGGEPDVVVMGGEAYICDCASESPRRSLCYDEKALAERKKNPPSGSAEAEAGRIGVELMTEEQYYSLQTLGEFDLKTSSWIKTPKDIRKRGGALFCERRYGRVFTFHNGADSYYSVRGFRGIIRI